MHHSALLHVTKCDGNIRSVRSPFWRFDWLAGGDHGPISKYLPTFTEYFYLFPFQTFPWNNNDIYLWNISWVLWNIRDNRNSYFLIVSKLCALTKWSIWSCHSIFPSEIRPSNTSISLLSSQYRRWESRAAEADKYKYGSEGRDVTKCSLCLMHNLLQQLPARRWWQLEHWQPVAPRSLNIKVICPPAPVYPTECGGLEGGRRQPRVRPPLPVNYNNWIQARLLSPVSGQEKEANMHLTAR